MQLETGTNFYHSPSMQSTIHTTYSTPILICFDRSYYQHISFERSLFLGYHFTIPTLPRPNILPTHIHTTQNPVSVIYHTTQLPLPAFTRFAPLSHHHQSHSPFEWFPSSTPPPPTCFHCIVYWLTLIDPKHTLIHASCDWYHTLAVAHLA